MNIPFDNTHVTIETPRLLLRPFTEADLQYYFEYASIPGLGEMGGWAHHKTIAESEAGLQFYIQSKSAFAIYHKVDEKVIGEIGLWDSWTNKEEAYQHLKAKNISYALSKIYWGQGLMPEAAQALIEYGFTTLGLEAFGAEHFICNPQSGRVIEKCGFQFVRPGVFYSKELDKHFDELRYVLLR